MLHPFFQTSFRLWAVIIVSLALISGCSAQPEGASQIPDGIGKPYSIAGETAKRQDPPAGEALPVQQAQLPSQPPQPIQTAQPPTPEVNPLPEPPAEASAPPQTETVRLFIAGDAEKGTILEETTVELKEGDSVIDILKRAAEQNDIALEIRGMPFFAYVEGIAELYEFDHGAKSGWLYRVNGTFPGTGAGSFRPEPGDRIEWLYTLDLGNDFDENQESAN